jgi:hypothetical protein
MTKRRRQGMAGSILEQFAELKSDYEIGKTSRYKRAKTGIMTLGSHADYHYRTEAAYFDREKGTGTNRPDLSQSPFREPLRWPAK